VHKATLCIAHAESGRDGDVRQIGVFENRPEVLMKLAARLSKGGRRLSFCYEAGPCGYGLHRLLTGCGHECVVVAPSPIPVKAGDRVKTDRRDAVMLAKLHRAAELTSIWIPDAAHEAIRGLVRARATAGRSCPRHASICKASCCATIGSIEELVPGRWLSPLADHGTLCPSGAADRAAGLHSRRPGRRSPGRPANPANRGAAAELVDGPGSLRHSRPCAVSP